MAVFDEGHAPLLGASRAGLFVNFAGAGLSLALIAGIGVWGYKLIVRDVSGIPVVRAMEGEMRVLPENPGGSLSLHTGLAVNEVAAIGEAAAPEDRLVLAPPTEGLTEEDIEVQPMAEAAEVVSDDRLAGNTSPQQLPVLLKNAEDVAAPSEPLGAEEILELADQIASASEKFDDAAAPVALLQAISASVPGVKVSIRPTLRPVNLQAAVPTPAAAPIATTTNNSEVAVTTTDFPVGTNLVQLGAFPSPEVAASEWTRLSGRFGDLMGNKERVIQVTTRGGRTFYRLRATGFAERSDARRFCAALVAENADCIPVVVN